MARYSPFLNTWCFPPDLIDLHTPISSSRWWCPQQLLPSPLPVRLPPTGRLHSRSRGHLPGLPRLRDQTTLLIHPPDVLLRTWLSLSFPIFSIDWCSVISWYFPLCCCVLYNLSHRYFKINLLCLDIEFTIYISKVWVLAIFMKFLCLDRVYDFYQLNDFFLQTSFIYNSHCLGKKPLNKSMKKTTCLHLAIWGRYILTSFVQNIAQS